MTNRLPEPPAPLAAHTLSELFHLQDAVAAELRRRGVLRSANTPTAALRTAQDA